MFSSLLKLLLPLAILNSIGARVLQPKFYGQDSAIIVDTDKSLQSKLNPKLQNALYYNIPVYKLFKPGNQFSAPTTTTTTTTAAPIGVAEQYPSDLLHIARNKLGLKRLDQLPSIRELGELLGTGNAEDTIKYIRALTSNDQGIALMKAYLGSLDYEQSEPEMEAEPNDSEDDNDMDNADIDADYDNAMPLNRPKVESTTKSAQWDESGGLMQRVNEFMKQYGMWADETTTTTTTTTAKPMIYRPMFVAPQTQLPTTPIGNVPRLVHVRQPLPYHYPIPLRAAVKPTPTMVPSTTAAPTPPHLNSPKVLPIETAAAVSASGVKVAPHIRQLADMANIPPSVLDTFLQQQPKLAELAKRVSRLPLVQQHNRAIDGQLLVAVKKALSQDENLQRLLNASQTLK